ncbi:MAG: sulfatase [bacterium]|nr:sulfatase [bacterium]
MLSTAAVLFAYATFTLSIAASDKNPNIVLIMADDLGWKDLQCYGNAQLDTPSIDQLAAQGMRFTDAYAASPVCTPTRAAVMTGQSPARLGITNHAPGHPDKFRPDGSNVAEADWTRHLDLEHVTIAERLKDAEYATGFFGKWHLSYRPRGSQEPPLETALRAEWQGFDVNIGGCDRGGPPSYFEPYRIPNIPPRKEGEYLPDRLADEAIDFLRSNREKPFFLCWWNYSVHYPFEAPQHLIDKYQDRVGPEIKNPTYAAMIEGMDRAIGRVLQTLDELELSANTLVIFTSDNGAYNSDMRPLRGEKGHLHEGGIRVPLIVRWPGSVQPGSICSTPVISMDFYPTLLEAAGLVPDRDKVLDGESLLPLLTQAGELTRKTLYFHYPNYAFHQQNRLGSAIREGAWKLIRYYDDDSVELYNLENDIGETQDLSGTSAELAQILKDKLSTWLHETGAKLPTPVGE